MHLHLSISCSSIEKKIYVPNETVTNVMINYVPNETNVFDD